MTHTVTSSEPNEKIAFDIIGSFKYPDGRKLYGLTIQDDFTKYILFVGIKDCTAPTVAKALIDNWILYFGIPKILLSDNGSNLCGKIMSAVSVRNTQVLIRLMLKFSFQVHRHHGSRVPVGEKPGQCQPVL